ncbi:MAG: hypothetical protein ACK559_32750, partial [bacterium]
HRAIAVEVGRVRARRAPRGKQRREIRRADASIAVEVGGAARARAGARRRNRDRARVEHEILVRLEVAVRGHRRRHLQRALQRTCVTRRERANGE